MLKNIVKALEPSSTLKINEISRELEKKGKKIFKFGFGQSPFQIPNDIVRALKDNAYQNLVGLSAGIVLEYFLPYAANTTYVDLIVSRNSKCKTYDEFDYEHSSQPEGLFDDVLE